MESEQRKVDEQFIKRVIAIITATAFVASVAYLYTYWSNFEINAFEFVDISNIITYSILPLLIGIIFVPTFIGLWFGVRFFIFFTFVNKLSIHEDSSIKKFRLKTTMLSSLTLLVILVIVVVIALQDYTRWTWFPPIFAVFLLMLFSIFHEYFKNRFIKPKSVIPVLFLAFVFIPLHSMIFGRVQAEYIKRGDKYSYVEGININKEVRKWDDDKIRYIGTMGDSVFFLIPSDNSIYIAAKEEIKPFVLKRYDKHKDKQEEENKE